MSEINQGHTLLCSELKHLYTGLLVAVLKDSCCVLNRVVVVAVVVVVMIGAVAVDVVGDVDVGVDQEQSVLEIKNETLEHLHQRI